MKKVYTEGESQEKKIKTFENRNESKICATLAEDMFSINVAFVFMRTFCVARVSRYGFSRK